ncbi:hypothetical protein OSB04_008109 [Centaurea solstitialis]|uniref:non-specific serine/threonine protein kinase n=1 Tax=Centaurea solstitialis TaxID=347529 RepID=A0AA38TL58_9ASTR|nr:hypothetical protein OSB04_008109 [Centaurea solstitialis]
MVVVAGSGSSPEIVARVLQKTGIVVRVINALFNGWGISEDLVTRMGWNISGEPCSGTAVDSTDLGSPNVGIKCACDFPNSTCHITQLGFGGNNFTGSLPSELGNLRRLEQIYMDSCGVGGPIPSTFANLRNMVTVWASDNAFTGRIPDFIGNWSRLQTLRFVGNSFEGSVPPTFSRLTSLQELYEVPEYPVSIYDLSYVTSTSFLASFVIVKMKVLRNNRLSGPIPTDIGEYHSLRLLFLGNNSLNGTLPDVKSTNLTNIDLSYNELSGTLPSWVNERNLQINLVVNNFTLGGASSSGLPSGLECLQRNFPCNHSDFGINCGGPLITSSNQLNHEQDTEALGAATYYLTPERRWGVSNVGQRDNPMYRIASSSQFTNTLDSELFQTARVSAGSLRYYGLGLENGNYTVTLQFVELRIENGPTWKSLGRRVFDIYLQGNRVIQDFDIKREARGDSFSPISRQVTARVTDNYLEVHLFWSGKGTCCIPQQGDFGPLISAISATPSKISSLNSVA